VWLENGRLVTVRPIVRTDLDALRFFFAGLTPASLRLRFHVGLKELPEHLLHKFMAIDDGRQVAFVAEARESPTNQTGKLVAEARYARYADLDSAEFALVVAEDWRRSGLGKSLVKTLMRHARLAGVRRLCADVLWENEPVHRLMRSLGARYVSGTAGSGTVQMCFDL
jgi:acetyltransferase